MLVLIAPTMSPPLPAHPSTSGGLTRPSPACHDRPIAAAPSPVWTHASCLQGDASRSPWPPPPSLPAASWAMSHSRNLLSPLPTERPAVPPYLSPLLCLQDKVPLSSQCPAWPPPSQAGLLPSGSPHQNTMRHLSMRPWGALSDCWEYLCSVCPPLIWKCHAAHVPPDPSPRGP